MVFEPRLLPGGGATEMAVSQALSKKAQVALAVNKSLLTMASCVGIWHGGGMSCA